MHCNRALQVPVHEGAGCAAGMCRSRSLLSLRSRLPWLRLDASSFRAAERQGTEQPRSDEPRTVSASGRVRQRCSVSA
eukprot:5706577-Prymnesium_polylepis.1